MNLIDLSETLTINVDLIKGVEKTEEGTRVYIELSDSIHSVLTFIPFQSMKELLKLKQTKNQSDTLQTRKVEDALEQLAKYQQFTRH